MVERHADEQNDLQHFDRLAAIARAMIERARGALSGLGANSGAALAAASRQLSEGRSRPWFRANALPLGISAVWVLALVTYGIGYFNRLRETGSYLPSLDLMFFCFAVAGPVGMIWIVVALLRRSERLTEAIADQNETVLALATSVSTLAANVDAVSAGTTGRLEDACYRMERDAATSAARLDRALVDITTKVDATLLDSVILLDRSTRDRTAHVEKMLETDRELLIKRLDTDAETLALRIDEILGGIDDRLGTSLAQALADQRQRVEDATGKIEAAIESVAARVEETARDRQNLLDDSVRQNIATLRDAVDMATSMLESGLVQPVQSISDKLEATANAIAANPPASAGELARLLGEAATEMVRHERELLADNLGRITALEERAETLLRQIDRTSRLNPLMEPQAVPAAPAPASGPDSLPLGVLPHTAARMALDWTALVDILEGGPPRPGTRQAVEATMADPDVALMVATGQTVLDALAEEEIFLQDLHPEHVPAALWHRFGQGERGGEIATLAGIGDEIALAIVRARMRKDAGFRSTALRFADAYIRLVERAADQIGLDQRLIEMADTRLGRAFLLIAGLSELFERRVVMPTDGQD